MDREDFVFLNTINGYQRHKNIVAIKINTFRSFSTFTDIITSALCTPFNVHAAFVQRWDMPEIMCKVCPFLQNICLNVQIMNLVLIAKDR